MTLKEYIKTAPNENAAVAIRNICNAFIEKVAPNLLISDLEWCAFVKVLAEYLTGEFTEDRIESVERMLDIYRMYIGAGSDGE